MSSALEKWQITVDVNKISQVFRNLISNALKFTQRNGKVSVYSSYCNVDTQTSIQPSMLRVVIKDSGIGISKVRYTLLIYIEF